MGSLDEGRRVAKRARNKGWWDDCSGVEMDRRNWFRIGSLLCYTARRTFILDLLCALYAFRVYLSLAQTGSYDSNRLLWLCVAKYHGMSVSLSLVSIQWTMCFAFRTKLTRLRDWCWRWCGKYPKVGRLILLVTALLGGRYRDSPCHDHVVYAVRFLLSVVIHSLVHIIVTHRLFALADDGFFEVVQLWTVYRWTISGYIMILLTLMIVGSGHRLVRFSDLHATIRSFHYVLYVLLVLLLTVHMSNRVTLCLALGLFSLETACEIRMTRRLQVQRVIVFRESPESSSDQRSAVIEINVKSDELARDYHCGNYVRMMVPRISTLQWHSFTLIPSVYHRGKFRILIRTVGRWTRALYDLKAELDHVWISGPYQNESEVRLTNLFVNPIAALSDAAMIRCGSGFHAVDPNVQLCLICTGLSITRHLALLTHYVKCYVSLVSRTGGGRLVNDGHSRLRTTPYACCDASCSNALPGRIKLIWSVSKSFDINLAIRTLNELQRCLVQHGWQSLFLYDVFVTRAPTLDELVANERLHSFLGADETYSFVDYNDRDADDRGQYDDYYHHSGDVESETRGTVAQRGDRADQTLRGLRNSCFSINIDKPVSRPDVYSVDSCRTFYWDEMSHVICDYVGLDWKRKKVKTDIKTATGGNSVNHTTTFFSHFYSNTNLRVGQRVRNWNSLLFYSSKVPTAGDSGNPNNNNSSNNNHNSNQSSSVSHRDKNNDNSSDRRRRRNSSSSGSGRKSNDIVVTVDKADSIDVDDIDIFGVDGGGCDDDHGDDRSSMTLKPVKTVIVLTTGVQQIIDDIRSVVSTVASDSLLELHVERLW